MEFDPEAPFRELYTRMKAFKVTEPRREDAPMSKRAQRKVRVHLNSQQMVLALNFDDSFKDEER